MGAAPVRRRPSGWYAALYRRTYGDIAVERKGVPAGAWIGALCVVAGVFTPWIRSSGDWISAATSLDVPLRTTWAADAPTGTGSGIWDDVTGIPVGFLAIVLAALAVASLGGWLPGWVKTVAALGIVVMPSAVAAQINDALSGSGETFLGVVGPGLLLMVVGGVVLGLTKPRQGKR